MVIIATQKGIRVFDEVVEVLQTGRVNYSPLRPNALLLDCDFADLTVPSFPSLEVIEIDGTRVDSGKDSLLRAIAEACAFPNYFGMNWAALSDSLEELPEERSANVLLVFKGYSTLVDSISVKDFGNLLDVLEEVGPSDEGGSDYFSVGALFCRDVES